MVWAGRGSNLVGVGRAQGDLDALQSPQILLIARLCAVEEIGQRDLEMCGEGWPVCPAIVGGTRARNHVPEHLLLVVVPLDLDTVQHGDRFWCCTPTLGGSTRASSGLSSGIRTITLTFNGAMRAIPNAADEGASGYGKLILASLIK